MGYVLLQLLYIINAFDIATENAVSTMLKQLSVLVLLISKFVCFSNFAELKFSICV